MPYWCWWNHHNILIFVACPSPFYHHKYYKWIETTKHQSIWVVYDCFTNIHWVGLLGKIWKPETHWFLPSNLMGFPMFSGKFSHDPILRNIGWHIKPYIKIGFSSVFLYFPVNFLITPHFEEHWLTIMAGDLHGPVVVALVAWQRGDRSSVLDI